MKLELIKPHKALNKAYFKQDLKRSQIELFKANLKSLFERVVASDKESEEHFKNIIVEFLNDTYYKGQYYINRDKRKDLVIHDGKSKSDPINVIIEAKSPTNKGEMISKGKPNAKALQELLHYFLEERFIKEKKDVKHLIITNVEDWFIFDGEDFERFFFENKKLAKQYIDWKAGLFGVGKTDWLYEEIAKPFIETIDISAVYFNLKNAENALSKKGDDKKLIELYKILSPEHLLKKQFANDSNTLNKEFYSELLHIIGLEETKDTGKKLINQKSEDTRDDASLLENTINILKTRHKVKDVADVDGQLYSVGLELCITWLNRILFLKLLEGQLIKYHKGDKSFAFLNTARIKDYDELNELFFEVLAEPESKRSTSVKSKFGNIPYLNSSLFEENELETETIVISDLKDRLEIPYYSATVIKDITGKRITGKVNTLEYFFKFLDAYNFSSDSTAEIQEENKTIISASVLGLIFEKINGYKDGSFFTPGYITMFMCRETIRRAVIQKFNDTQEWNCKDEVDLYNKIDKLSLADANKIFNTVRVCDPAVGSGHYLVSALNEMVSFKSYLGILAHPNGKKLKGYKIEIENDEIIITSEDIIYEYNYKDEESQFVQETLFNAKQVIIENCLFGADINPKSVLICRLRLWVELLKNAYYKQGADVKKGVLELQTLPNIDINIKCGNSLISRFRTGFDITAFRNQKLRTAFLKEFDNYRTSVFAYKLAKGKAEKDKIRVQQKHFKETVSKFFLADQKDWVEIKELENKLGITALDFDFGETIAEEFNKKTKRQHDEIAEKKKAFLEKYTAIYEHAIEWRFEFPEVLDPKTAEYIGFDAVIGNPPYIRQEKLDTLFKEQWQLMFPSVASTTADIYVYFFGLALQIGKANAYISFITLNKWLKTKYGNNLRKALAKLNTNYIIDFFELPVFEEASTDSAITLLQLRETDSNSKYYPVKTLKDLNLFSLMEKGSFSSIEKSEAEWQFVSGGFQTILEKLNSDSTTLKEFTEEKIYRGMVTGANEVFIIDNELKESLIRANPKAKQIILPYATPTEFSRYAITGEPLWFINSHNGFMITKDDFNRTSKKKGDKTILDYRGFKVEVFRKEERGKNNYRINRIDVQKDYPAVYDYLSEHEEKLVNRGDKGEHWTNLRNCDYLYAFNEPKLIYVYTAKNHPFFYDTESHMINNSSYMIVSENRFLWAFFNSNLFIWFMKIKFVAYGDADEGGRVKLDLNKMETVPIKTLTETQNAKVDKLVNELFELKQKNQDADVSKKEEALNKLIYDVYGLTLEEINIVEGK